MQGGMRHAPTAAPCRRAQHHCDGAGGQGSHQLPCQVGGGSLGAVVVQGIAQCYRDRQHLSVGGHAAGLLCSLR